MFPDSRIFDRETFVPDLDTDTTPLEAGLEFAVRWDKDFIGRDALLQLKDRLPKQRMVTIVLDDGQAVPLGSEPVHVGDRIVGKTTSAAFGDRIGKPVALAMIDSEPLAEVRERRVDIGIVGTRAHGTVMFEAAYDPEGTRMRLRA